jgi:hypothetical protein
MLAKTVFYVGERKIPVNEGAYDEYKEDDGEE